MNASFRLLPFALLCALAVPAAGCAKGPATPSVELNGHSYSIEIAEDDASRAHGLMDRESMPADHGMLFVFQDDAMRGFWMKNCKFAQDMLFFNEERKLISVQANVPPCTTDPCPSYSSGAPARYVLELNAGQAKALGAHPGDELTIHR